MTFHEDLKAGEGAETYLINKYPGKLIKSNDRRWDLETLSGKKLELKLERRPAEKLKNLFIESIANESKQSLGGPNRAQADGVDYFGWLVSDTRELYLYETEKLCQLIDEIIEQHNLQPKRIPNKGYVTLGYAISIPLLKPYSIDILDIL